MTISKSLPAVLYFDDRPTLLELRHYTHKRVTNG